MPPDPPQEGPIPPHQQEHQRAPIDDPDLLLTQAAETVARRADTRFDRAVLRMTAWFADHTLVRLVVAASLLIGALLPGAILLFYPDLTDGIEGFGYLGVFLTNLASTATFYFPVPGLTAAAQALIATEGADARLPWLVGSPADSAWPWAKSRRTTPDTWEPTHARPGYPRSQAFPPIHRARHGPRLVADEQTRASRNSRSISQWWRTVYPCSG